MQNLILTGLTRQLAEVLKLVTRRPSLSFCAKKGSVIFDTSFFDVKNRESNKAIRRIETVRWTVSVPACVPKKALAFNGRVSPSAPKKEVSFFDTSFFGACVRAEESVLTCSSSLPLPLLFFCL